MNMEDDIKKVLLNYAESVYEIETELREKRLEYNIKQCELEKFRAQNTLRASTLDLTSQEKAAKVRLVTHDRELELIKLRGDIIALEIELRRLHNEKSVAEELSHRQMAEMKII